MRAHLGGDDMAVARRLTRTEGADVFGKRESPLLR